VGSLGSAVSEDDNSRHRRLAFADALEHAADPEPISAIVIGPFGRGDGFGEERITRPVSVRVGELLTWDEARPMLDYEFGTPQCDAIYAWTENKVLVVYEYDGSTQILTIPRNPTPAEVRFPGAI
jgi:hypothetical protein